MGSEWMFRRMVCSCPESRTGISFSGRNRPSPRCGGCARGSSKLRKLQFRCHGIVQIHGAFSLLLCSFAISIVSSACSTSSKLWIVCFAGLCSLYERVRVDKQCAKLDSAPFRQKHANVGKNVTPFSLFQQCCSLSYTGVWRAPRYPARIISICTSSVEINRVYLARIISVLVLAIGGAGRIF